jgi:hypothetical protein
MMKFKGTLCYGCSRRQPDRLRQVGDKFITLGYGCGNYGFNRSFNKGFKPRKKRCKHYDENY